MRPIDVTFFSILNAAHIAVRKVMLDPTCVCLWVPLDTHGEYFSVLFRAGAISLSSIARSRIISRAFLIS